MGIKSIPEGGVQSRFRISGSIYPYEPNLLWMDNQGALKIFF